MICIVCVKQGTDYFSFNFFGFIYSQCKKKLNKNIYSKILLKQVCV